VKFFPPPLGEGEIWSLKHIYIKGGKNIILQRGKGRGEYGY